MEGKDKQSDRITSESTSGSESKDEYLIHRLILRKDLGELEKFIEEARSQTEFNQEVFQELLTKVDPNGFTPLTLAAKMSYRDYSQMLPIMEYLLSLNAGNGFALKLDMRGMNIFDEAVYAKNNDLLEYLFKKEAKRYFKKIDKRV